MLDTLAAQQARQLRQAITQADLTLAQLWWHYLSLGGNTGQLEVEVYLHQALDLPCAERDLLDHAAHELITG
jgi:hypothetical protein